MSLSSTSYGQLYHLNYPQFLPNNVNFTQHLVAPLGHVVLLEIYGVGFSENRCHGGGSLEVKAVQLKLCACIISIVHMCSDIRQLCGQ